MLRPQRRAMVDRDDRPRKGEEVGVGGVALQGPAARDQHALERWLGTADLCLDAIEQRCERERHDLDRPAALLLHREVIEQRAADGRQARPGLVGTDRENRRALSAWGAPPAGRPSRSSEPIAARATAPASRSRRRSARHPAGSPRRASPPARNVASCASRRPRWAA